MKAAAIGDNCIDLYDNTGRYHVTGNALDFAVNMHRLGIPTSLISITGNDRFGQDTLNVMQEENIDISHLKTETGRTAISHMTLKGRERTYGEYEEGVMKNVKFSRDSIDFAASHNMVHTAFWGNAHMHLEELRKFGAIISFDYATEWRDSLVKDTIEFVDYAFFSFENSNSEIKDFLQSIVEAGAKMSIGTLGEKGSVVWDGKEWHRFGIITAKKLVNTVGAGDSYIAGFMYGILNGLSIMDAQKKGAEKAAEVVSVFEPWTNYKGDIYI